jgi:hypothetical protein
MEKLISRIIIGWMILIIITILCLYNKMDEEAQKFYIFGPNNNLIIFGLQINSYVKYSIVIFYCVINSSIRTSYNDVLRPWLINSIQDINVEKKPEIVFFAYEVTYVTTIYNWFDWYIYMNILLSQVDMLIVEITSDLLMSGLITRYYLTYKIQDKKSKEIELVVEENEIILNVNEILV